MASPLPRFSGLRQPESIILDAWQKSNAPTGAAFVYNVPIGKGTEADTAMPAHLKAMHYRNSQRKVDAIMQAGALTTIIEVKERAQLGSVGQLLGYQHLYEQEHPGSGSPDMLLLTARLSPGVKEVAERYGIKVVVVPADFSSVTTAV